MGEKPLIVDVHAHCAPGEITHAQLANTPDTRSLAMTDSSEDVAHRLRRMDEAGIDMQVLMGGTGQYREDAASSAEEARRINKGLADLSCRHPDRLSAYLCLPLPHVDASLRELDAYFDADGIVGVVAHCFVLQELSIADPRFDPIFAGLNDRGAVLFIHPAVNGICSPFVNDWNLAAAMGTVLEDTMAVLHLIIRQIPHRFPNIKIVMPHLGGPLSTMLSRLDGQMPWAHPDLPEPPSVTAKRFWYDCVAHGSRPAVKCACDVFGSSQLLPGSDYPFIHAAGYRDILDTIREAGLGEGAAERIIYQNAASLFKFKKERPRR